MTASDFDFEGDGLLTKRQLADLSGVPPKTIDGWTRAGCPVQSGKFDVKQVFGWLAAKKAKAVDDQPSPMEAAKARKVIAEAEKAERENRLRAGELIEREPVALLIGQKTAAMRTAMLDIPDRLTAQPIEVREAVRDEIIAAFERWNVTLPNATA